MAISLSGAIALPRRWRETWRATQHRLVALEKGQQETQMLLELLLSDAVHSKHCEVGMHAQQYRRAMVEQLFNVLQLQVAVETGTYIGRTTNYLARTFKVPVYSSELIPRYHHIARRMLRELANVHLSLADSRDFLRGLANDAGMAMQRTFFYLDAHWYNDLPLADEVEIIVGAWPEFVILVDDFRVPGDDGYTYDDYGLGKVLDLEYLAPLLNRHGLTAFFPATRSENESGARTGYVVIAPATTAQAVLGIELLRKHEQR